MSEIFIEGDTVKPFRIFRLDENGNPGECEPEYDTLTEASTHRFALARRDKVSVRGKFITKPQFEQLAKNSNA
jgi:hypothetical protein